MNNKYDHKNDLNLCELRMPQKNHEKSERPMFHQKCCFTRDFSTRQVAELEVQMAEVLSIAVRIVSGLVSGRDLCRCVARHGTGRMAWHDFQSISITYIYVLFIYFSMNLSHEFNEPYTTKVSTCLQVSVRQSLQRSMNRRPARTKSFDQQILDGSSTCQYKTLWQYTKNARQGYCQRTYENSWKEIVRVSEDFEVSRECQCHRGFAFQHLKPRSPALRLQH